ncbi:cytochrome P460 family protein [Geomesophilobacter sediminis]|uniref:Cytochrome P460 family protein n=1 Tax=Geomesophilobacter sediminis TaxID=2798584 RepID=A0A8J7M0W6_9BACT|nr:cytochrome P460 family protein [Geomesophilobacter sediminis]MBJ6726526.1 cytochrome P460 family protein [Geomesophilobacter sediminis]
MKKIGVIATVAALLAFAGSALAAEPPLPKGYEKWEKSKQRMDPDKKSMFYGIHYIYVDKKTMKPYKTGGPFPEGSRFVVVNYTIKDVNGKKVQGKKSMIVLMQKDKKQTATGGWLYAGYTPDGKPSGVDPKICFECHDKEAKARDYVISKYSDFK